MFDHLYFEMENVMNNKPLIILTGPTSVGKTDASLRLAKRVNGEIISADSMQIYKYMDIGTAKIMPDEMNGIEHHLIDDLSPDCPFDVYEFKKRANQCVNEIYEKRKIPIVVGGTGFYIQALLYDIDFSEEHSDQQYRKELEQLAAEKGPEYLHQKLEEVDIKSANSIHYNNVKRVIRALEYFHENNKPISEHNEEQRQRTSPFNFLYFVLTMERKKLYDRINYRVDQMIENGLQNEVNRLIENGCTKQMNSMQAIGYKEWFPYFDGNQSLDVTIDEIKKDTRHFAKRQLTWFRRERECTVIDKDQYHSEDEIVDKIIRMAKEKGIIEHEH